MIIQGPLSAQKVINYKENWISPELGLSAEFVSHLEMSVLQVKWSKKNKNMSFL